VIKGLVRPCRHHLSPELHDRWRAHLCGLCLTLRDRAGQSARVLTGYDTLLLSVLVEAQAGRQPTTIAGRCALRGMRTAEVVLPDRPAIRLAAAGSLLTGAAGLRDKIADGDLPYGTRFAAAKAAGRYEAQGVAIAGQLGLSPAPVLAAPAAAITVEAQPGATLDDLLAPTGVVVAALFAHTAEVAGRPTNAAALSRAGDAFGRLAHLLDAATDLVHDARHGRFNPLAATGTTTAAAQQLAIALSGSVAQEVAGLAMAEPDLAGALLGPELGRAVSRTFSRRWRRRAGRAWDAVSPCLDVCDCCDCGCCDCCGGCDCCSC
jgi:hypothetical protein